MLKCALLLLMLPAVLFSERANADESCGMEKSSYGIYTVWRRADLVVFEAGMTIDADGSPRAYHPDSDKGLDDLKNAGYKGAWSALATREGDPIVQGAGDPAPGYFVSTTALADETRSPLQAQFVNAEEVPYIALPPQLEAQLGDLAAVVNAHNGRVSGAIFADVGPENHLGEGSIALARELDINDSARWGGTRGGVTYVVFVGSGVGKPMPAERIQSESRRLWDESGVDEVLECVQKQQ